MIFIIIRIFKDQRLGNNNFCRNYAKKTMISINKPETHFFESFKSAAD